MPLHLRRSSSRTPPTVTHVWGLGAVLHEAATRRVALADLADLADTDTSQLEAPMPPASRARPGLGRERAALVDACLRADPVARPSITDLLRGLAALTA